MGAPKFRLLFFYRKATVCMRVASLRCAIVLVFLTALGTSYAWGSIATDAVVSKDGSSASATIASPAFSTSTSNELLLAFVATDYVGGTNTTVKSIAGASLTWTLVQRTNGQSGTAEIWRAFATAPLSSVTVTASLSQSVVSSLTVMSFAGVSTAGANGSGAIGAVGSKSAVSGAPTAALVSTAANSWVVGVGNDFDNDRTNIGKRTDPDPPASDSHWGYLLGADADRFGCGERDQRNHQRHGADQGSVQPEYR